MYFICIFSSGEFSPISVEKSKETLQFCFQNRLLKYFLSNPGVWQLLSHENYKSSLNNKKNDYAKKLTILFKVLSSVSLVYDGVIIFNFSYT